MPFTRDRRMAGYWCLDVSESHAAEVDRQPIRRGLDLSPLVGPRERIIDSFGSHQLECLNRIERRLQHEAPARGECCSKRHHEIARPEEAIRRPAADVVLRVKLTHSAKAPHLYGDTAMCTEDPFRLARRTRRKEHDSDIAWARCFGCRADQFVRLVSATRNKGVPRVDATRRIADGC